MSIKVFLVAALFTVVTLLGYKYAERFIQTEVVLPVEWTLSRAN